MGDKAVLALSLEDVQNEVFGQGGVYVSVTYSVKDRVPKPKVFMGQAVGGRPDTGVFFLGGIKLTLHYRNTFCVKGSIFIVVVKREFFIKGKTLLLYRL